MPEDPNLNRDLEAFVSRFETDAAVDGLERAWSRHFVELVRWHKTAGAHRAALLGPHLERILRSDPKVARELTGRPAVANAPKPVVVDAVADRAQRLEAVRGLADRAAAFTEILEGDGTPMLCIEKVTFENWGRTVRNIPALTCFPRTKAGVGNIVTWAGSRGKKIRVSGYRHTWTDFYSNDGEVLISLLPLPVVTDLPATEPPIDPHNELQGIKVIGTINEGGVTKALCKIGAATTNEQFRRWCLDPAGGNLSWTVPLNVIMVEITWGGSNAPICHGAGWRNQTLSDLVAAIEFVNARGQLQVVDNPDQLRAASGAFGLLGVVTAITLKLDPMTFARLQPEKRRVALAVPPISRKQVPDGVDMAGVTDSDIQAAQADFFHRCEHDYYAEWFWFTFQKDCWINTWQNDGNRSDSVDYPSPLDADLQAAGEFAAELLIQSEPFSWLSETWQATLLGGAAMALLPDSGTVTTPLIDALHFRRGIQNMRVLDMEWEIPIPAVAGKPNTPNWSVCQHAWWAVIGEVYRLEQQDKAPMRLTLEMRIMGGSGVTMAPQYGNQLGTCSIEVLTTLNTDAGDWAAFMQSITDLWAGIGDASGYPLNLRPHWAKQWQGLKVRGTPIVDYLRTNAYADRLPEFKNGLAAVAQAGGSTMKDLQRLFSNQFLDLVFSDLFK